MCDAEMERDCHRNYNWLEVETQNQPKLTYLQYNSFIYSLGNIAKEKWKDYKKTKASAMRLCLLI